jgi:nuclear GTP-binding protein
VFERSDERMLSEIRPRKDLRKEKNGLVQLKGAIADERQVDLEATVDQIGEEYSNDDGVSPTGKELRGEMDIDDEDEESEDDDFSGDGKEDDSDGMESGSEEESGEMDEDDEVEFESDEQQSILPAVPSKLSGKKGRAERGSGKQSLASKKRVSFAPYTKAGMTPKEAKAIVANKPTKSMAAKGIVSSTTKRASNLPSSRKGAPKAGGGEVQRDEDAYDFSKYF